MAGDASSHTFLREILQCWLTGQAAGSTAALAPRSGVPLRTIDFGRLPAELLRQARMELGLQRPSLAASAI
jgi:hypothetical protein